MSGDIDRARGVMGDEQKIKVQCLCGKRYKVSIEKSGSEVSCGNCGASLTIPKPQSVTGRTRKLILAELGIDAEAEEKKYKDEVAKENASSSGDRVYNCMKCDVKIKASDLKGCYVKGELICKGCQASSLIEDRRLAEEALAATGKDRKKQKAHERVLKTRETTAAVWKGFKYGILVFVGFGGPIWGLGGGWIKALAVGLVLGAAVGFYVHNREVT
ncbi:hypothetical protein HY251_15805 [bacterium]|nr:hypothetical protein [bacterium]